MRVIGSIVMRLLISILLVLVAVLAIAEDDRAEDRVERDRGGEALVDAVLDGLLDVGHGALVIETEPELLERDMGQVEHLRAAEILFAVDLRVVLLRVLLDAVVCFFQQLVALAEDDGFRRANGGARRLKTLRQPLLAEL